MKDVKKNIYAGTPEAGSAYADSVAAYKSAIAQAPTVPVDSSSSNLDQQTFTAGVYVWTTQITLPKSGVMTIKGSASDVFIFQAPSLNFSAGSTDNIGYRGASASNVFFVTTGSQFLGYGGAFFGMFLAQGDIFLSAAAFSQGGLYTQGSFIGVRAYHQLSDGSCPPIVASTSQFVSACTHLALGAKCSTYLLCDTAGAFTVVAMTGISTVPTSNITGNIGISPAAMTYLTGFALASAGPGTPSSSAQVSGMAFAPETTNSKSPQAVLDMQNAYTLQMVDGGGAGRRRNPHAYWSKVILTGGLTSNSIYWAGATSLTTGVASQFSGIILTYTNVVIGTGGSLNGSIYTQTEVALDKAMVLPPTVC
ncbi:hypothetical protein RQP46_011426 [Phenoliferia psychrophenolica]